jgi:AhpD family alkylhydroperoxidase
LILVNEPGTALVPAQRRNRPFLTSGNDPYLGEVKETAQIYLAWCIGIANRCDPCIAWHAKAARTLGGMRQEIIETIGVTVQMGGGLSPLRD